ncbi:MULTISPECIES: serine hydrolase domain-containing protein [unclassified Nocardia]|uniref:serine hydrolase domain-containing protein n=1 Tax=unclassified Nocardia TaxID=2637762 RepID=UPI0033B2AE80
MRTRVLALAICTTAVLLSSCTTGAAEPLPSGVATRADTVQADLDGLIGSGAVGALATLTDNGTIVLAAGTTDLTTPMPTDPPQHVRVGSITKTFTAAVVLQLVAEGKVELDRPVDMYLPGLLTGDGIDGRVITVRQILGHRSGLPEPIEALGVDEHTAAARLGRTFTPAEEIALALRYPARFSPGARFEYTNTNYIVAGMLIEAVTGRAYGDELRERIFAPLGLSGTYLPATGETGLRDPHPTGYTTVDGSVTDETLMEPSVPWASGALVSTGADLNRFYTALLAGRVVSLTQLLPMLDGVDMGGDDGMSYGLGVGYTRLPCGARFVGHVGGVRGFTAVSGATEGGRAVTFSFTGTHTAAEIGTLLTHALCD